MTGNKKGLELIDELLSDPDLFMKQRKVYVLYKEYSQGGLELETLVPLLNSSDVDVVAAAMWIASEIAQSACTLFPHVVQHVESSSPFIRYHSLVFIMLCTTENHREAFIYIVQSITDEKINIGMLGMLLLAKADVSQLSMAIEIVEKYYPNSYELHRAGLFCLLNDKESDETEILNMLNSHEGLIQQYGAILIKRKGGRDLKLIDEAIRSSNTVVHEFGLALRDLL